MAYSFACPECQARNQATSKIVGRQVRCAQCGATITVPPRPATDEPRHLGERTPPSGGADALPVDMSSDQGGLAGGPKRKGIDDEMDLTPMVDVTFQLLIFFIITAAFSLQKSLEVPKPKQKEQSTQVVQFNPEEDPQYVTVYVDEFSTYRVVTVDWDVEAPSEHELLRKLREARAGNTAGVVPTKLLVKAHTDSFHEKVVAALDAGAEVGMEDVQLATMEEAEP